MANILMPVKFQFGTLFEDFYIRYISNHHKKSDLLSRSEGLKRIENLCWYFLLHNRNNANNLHKIAITNCDKQAAAKSFILSFSAATQT